MYRGITITILINDMWHVNNYSLLIEVDPTVHHRYMVHVCSVPCVSAQTIANEHA